MNLEQERLQVYSALCEVRDVCGKVRFHLVGEYHALAYSEFEALVSRFRQPTIPPQKFVVLVETNALVKSQQTFDGTAGEFLLYAPSTVSPVNFLAFCYWNDIRLDNVKALVPYDPRLFDPREVSKQLLEKELVVENDHGFYLPGPKLLTSIDLLKQVVTTLVSSWDAQVAAVFQYQQSAGLVDPKVYKDYLSVLSRRISASREYFKNNVDLVVNTQSRHAEFLVNTVQTLYLDVTHASALLCDYALDFHLKKTLQDVELMTGVTDVYVFMGVAHLEHSTKLLENLGKFEASTLLPSTRRSSV